MSGALGLGTLLFAATLLVVLFAERPIAGLPPDEIAVIGSLGAVALVMTSWVINDFRRRWTDGLRSLAIWSVAFAALVVVSARRDDLVGVLDRMIGEVEPGRTVVTPEGEVVVARRVDGSFTLKGRINDRPTRFIFDTGASTVVLTAESAAASGFHPERLTYSVPVATANGRTLAAPITIETLAVGPISERRVQALVARPGVLRENLLGMTFLERLASYEVRGNRLILRAGS
jgi:aspartyl protease family protein